MADDMSWRSTASSRLSSFKGYLSSQRPEMKQVLSSSFRRHQGQDSPDGKSSVHSWREWAGQKIGRGQSYDLSNAGVDKIWLFPGWATRRYRKSVGGELEEAFEVEVFVSGFAFSHRAPELATRSQRAFMRVAKGFASLPKLQPLAAKPPGERPTLSPSTEQLLASIQLPPRPAEITDDFDMEALEKQFQRANVSDEPSSSASSVYSGDSDAFSLSRASTSDSESGSIGGMPTQIPSGEGHVGHPHAPKSLSSDLHRLHANLEARLQPFWSTALSARTVRISLFASPQRGQYANVENVDDVLEHGPVATQDAITSSDGSFQARFTIKWEDLCQHPHALHIAFGDPLVEHDLMLTASLLSLPSIATSAPAPKAAPVPAPPPPDPTQLCISLTHSPIRVVSDIDDTVKLSGILSGARTVFHNVFVKELKDSVIPGMGEWYGNMYDRGVRFHYVSNGPFELLPVVNEFFQISHLPPGSIKLKSYAGRSLFNGLLSAPATRKRAGVVDILDSFPLSRFILIGDTGEQDLELFSQLSSERPHQVLGVFVRDANMGAGASEEGLAGVVGPIDDPTGWKGASMSLEKKTSDSRPGTPTAGKQQSGSRPPFFSKSSLTETLNSLSSHTSSQPTPTPGMDITTPTTKKKGRSEPAPGTSTSEYFTPAPPPSTTTLTEEPGFYLSSGSRTNTPSPPSSTTSLSTHSSNSTSEVEKKRYELQLRVNRARSIMPVHVPLRVFRNPEECVEIEEILGRLHVGGP